MNEEEERDTYWQAVRLLNEIITSGNRSRQGLLDELDDDLDE